MMTNDDSTNEDYGKQIAVNVSSDNSICFTWLLNLLHLPIRPVKLTAPTY